MFNFKSYYDLSHDIANKISFLPKVDFVVGIPKSGLIPACIIASFLNKPLFDLDSFLFIHAKRSGSRKLNDSRIGCDPQQSVLIVDDSVNTGAELKRVRKLLALSESGFEYIYCAVYANDIKNLPPEVDLGLVSVPQPRVFQWNYRNHIIAEQACFDMDGVLCVDPTEEQNDDGPRYLEFIRTANPLFIPKKKISAIVTSRLERFRKETEDWLRVHDVKYGELIMLDLPSAEERRKRRAHAPFKAEIFKSRKDLVFIESNWKQAKQIAELADKPVLCTENDAFLYGKSHLNSLQKCEQLFSHDALNTTEALRLENEKLLERITKLECERLGPVDESNCINGFSLDNIKKSMWKRAEFLAQANAEGKLSPSAGKNPEPLKENFRVLMISISFDQKFGAGAAASSNRLKNAMIKNGIDVHTLSKENFPNFKTDLSGQPKSLKTTGFFNSYHNSEHSNVLREKVRSINPDVIVLGAVDRGIISLFDIVSLNYPIVWIGRDNWSHTGGCMFQLDMHIDRINDSVYEEFISLINCNKYKNECNNCDVISDINERSVAKLQFFLKKIVYQLRPDIVFAPISKWLEKVMGSAELTKNHLIRQVYNPIDLSEFRPLKENKKSLRKKLNLPLDNKLVLLAAFNLENKRKGAELLFKVLQDRRLSEDIEFVLIGKGSLENVPKKSRGRCHMLGFIDDDVKKVSLYNAIDATVVPALQESLSVVASDSICCGTPVVAFNTSGLTDFIRHKENGYLAKPFDARDFANGISWVCHNKDWGQLSKNARKVAESLFDENRNVQEYLKVFTEAINHHKNASKSQIELDFVEHIFESFGEILNGPQPSKVQTISKKYHIKSLASLGDNGKSNCDLKSSEKRPDDDQKNSLWNANRLFREGKYKEALEIYEKLKNTRSADMNSIYSVNAEMARERINSKNLM